MTKHEDLISLSGWVHGTVGEEPGRLPGIYAELGKLSGLLSCVSWTNVIELYTEVSLDLWRFNESGVSGEMSSQAIY